MEILNLSLGVVFVFVILLGMAWPLAVWLCWRELRQIRRALEAIAWTAERERHAPSVVATAIEGHSSLVPTERRSGVPLSMFGR